MTLAEKWFIVFLIINLIVTVIYFIFAVFRKRIPRRLIFMRSVMMLCAPGVGVLLIFLSWLCFKIFFRDPVDLSDVVFNKDKERELISVNEDNDRNVVPIEEAIEVTEKSDLRNLVMTVAQGDFEDSLSAIALALNCEDTETAHYAASVLQDALNDFRSKVAISYDEILKRKGDYIDKGLALIKYMNKVLVQKVFSDVEQSANVVKMDKVLEIIYDEDAEKITSDIYEIVCLRSLETEKYDLCEKWCSRAMAQYPGTLSSYTEYLKFYFNSGQKDKFFELLNELKATPIIIDKETLALIRTFQ